MIYELNQVHHNKHELIACMITNDVKFVFVCFLYECQFISLMNDEFKLIRQEECESRKNQKLKCSKTNLNAFSKTRRANTA